MRRLKALLATLLVLLSLVFIPSQVVATTPGVSGLVSKSATGTCATDYYAEVQCWGENNAGQADVPNTLGRVIDLTSGDYFNCAIDVATTVHCWGQWYWGQDYTIYVPQILQGKTGATHLDAHGADVCAVYEQRHIYCWGSNGDGQVKIYLDYGSASILDIANECVLTTLKEVRCKYPNSSWQTVIPSSADVREIESTSFQICALRGNGSISCFESYNDQRGAGQVIDKVTNAKFLATSSGMACAVLNTGRTTCWADPAQPHMTHSDVDSLTGVEEVYLGSYDCAKVAGALVCPNEAPPYLGRIELANLPTNLNTTILEDGRVRFRFETTSKPSDGTVLWHIRGTDNLSVCQFSETDFKDCTVPNHLVGNTYEYKVVGTNRAGQSTAVYFQSFMYCSPTPEIVLTPSANPIITGSYATYAGSLVRWCSNPSTLQYRSQDYGKSWTSWKTITLTNNQFSISKKFTYRTLLEFKVKNTPINYITKRETVLVRQKTSAPLTLTSKSKKLNGFNQGGYVYLKFKGDKVFNGTCSVVGNTAYAFNFALTYIGSERVVTTFKVKNGYGAGTLSMRWNGEVGVSALCRDSKFKDFSGATTVTFRASF